MIHGVWFNDNVVGPLRSLGSIWESGSVCQCHNLSQSQQLFWFYRSQAVLWPEELEHPLLWQNLLLIFHLKKKPKQSFEHLFSGLLKVSALLAGTDGYFSVSNCLQPFQKFLTLDSLTKFFPSLFSFFFCAFNFEKLLITAYSLKTVSWTEEKFSSEIFFDFQ